SIVGNVNGFLVSKGNRAYDALQTVEGIDVTNGNITPGSGCVRVTGECVTVRDGQYGGMVCVDASQASGAVIADIKSQGGDQNLDVGSTYPQSLYCVGFYAGNCGTIMNVRIQGKCWIAFALSGIGAACLGSSAEVTTIGCRIGWTPPIFLQTSTGASAGTRVLTFSSVPSWLSDLLDAGETV